MTRRNVIERLLVEATDNSPSKVSPGSVQLAEDGIVDWAEKTPRGLVSRTGLVHWPTLRDLMMEALS